MRSLKAAVVGIFLMTISGISHAGAASSVMIHVEKMAIGTAIDDHDLKGTASTFNGTIPRLYCWSKVTADSPPTTLHHIWYLNDTRVADVSLPIKYATMRTWSSKTPSPGTWKVDAVDGSGKVLSSVSFAVTK